MKWFPILLFILLQSFGFSGEPVKAMSFNIRYGTAKDGENHWDKRKDFVVDTIRDTAPDLLGTQETLAFQADYLADKLPPGYARYGKGRERFGRGERCELFWNTNRFELVKSGSFMLSETPDEHGSKSWDAALPRIASWVVLADKTEPSASPRSELFFINTHFDHRGANARTESAKLIRERATALAGDRPVVMMGDLNFGPSAPGYAPLAKAPWRDTYRVIHPVEIKGEGTFCGFRGKRSGNRIDYIFSRGLTVEAAAIDRRERDGRNPSDHFPVTASFAFPPAAESAPEPATSP